MLVLVEKIVPLLLVNSKSETFTGLEASRNLYLSNNFVKTLAYYFIQRKQRGLGVSKGFEP